MTLMHCVLTLFAEVSMLTNLPQPSPITSVLVAYSKEHQHNQAPGPDY